MILQMLAVLTALWQQPGRAPAATSADRLAAFDTTTATIGAVSDRVADVKSALDLFRRAVFNAPDGEVMITAEMFRARCHSLDSVAAAAPKRVCRSCAAPRVNAALSGYRRVMPVVARTGARCASRLERLANGPDGAKGLRREVRSIGNGIVAGFVPYERQLQVLTEALGVAPPRPAPARP